MTQGVEKAKIRPNAKVLEKIFAGFEKMTYLCSPFASQKWRCGFFKRFFELLVKIERKCSIYLSISFIWN